MTAPLRRLPDSDARLVRDALERYRDRLDGYACEARSWGDDPSASALECDRDRADELIQELSA